MSQRSVAQSSADWSLRWKGASLQELSIVDDGSDAVLEFAPVTSVASMIEFILRAVHKFGAPRRIRTDHSIPFCTKDFRDLLHSFGIEHRLRTADGPRSKARLADQKLMLN